MVGIKGEGEGEGGLTIGGVKREGGGLVKLISIVLGALWPGDGGIRVMFWRSIVV